MSKKSAERVSVSKLKDLHNASLPQMVEVVIDQSSETTMKVKKHLTATEFIQFVYDMGSTAFITDENGVENYMPGAESVIFKKHLVEYYSNVNLPKDAHLAYEIICSLELDKIILHVIGDTEQYKDLINAIEKARSYTISQKTGVNGLISMVKDKLNRFDIEKIMETIQNFSPEQLENFKELKELGNLFNSPLDNVNEFDNVIPFAVDELNDEDEIISDTKEESTSEVDGQIEQ